MAATITRAGTKAKASERGTTGRVEGGAKGAPAAGPVRRTAPAGMRDAERLSQAFRLLGDATRLRIVRHVATEGATNVTGLCGATRASQQAASHHLALLKAGGIVEPTREGQNIFYELTPRGEVLARLVADLEAAN